MVEPVLPRASAAIHAAVYAARRRGLGTERASSKTRQKSEVGNGNFVCSPLSILLVFAVAMRGARGRTFEEMERLLPLRELPALLRLTTYSNRESSSGREELSGDTEVESEEDISKSMRTELDVVSRMYVDGRLASNIYFRSFKEALLRECSSGEEQKEQLPVQLIDCKKAEETARDINAFVRDATRGHITDLVSADLITPWTRLLLVSAAFFRGPWRKPFHEYETEKATFYALEYSDEDIFFEHEAHEGEDDLAEKSEEKRSDQSHASAQGREPRLVAQNVDMMHVLLESPAELYLRVDKAVTAVGLPYANEKYVMYVVQPNDPRNLERLMRFKSEKSQTERFPTLEDVVRSMRESRGESQDVEAHLSLPKFALKAADNYLDLIPIFRRLLQIQAPFDRKVADFSGISGDHTLLMSAFVHQADIEVDEKGTIATAATMAAFALKMAFIPKKRVNILINKPFAFQIRYHPTEEPSAHGGGTSSKEGTNTTDAPELGDYVLFTGCVTDVLAAQQ